MCFLGVGVGREGGGEEGEGREKGSGFGDK